MQITRISVFLLSFCGRFNLYIYTVFTIDTDFWYFFAIFYGATFQFGRVFPHEIKSDCERIFVNELTLNEPKFLTEHAMRTFRPAGTVTFSIISVNSGSSTAENQKINLKIEIKVTK